jgi:hypothetical protein
LSRTVNGFTLECGAGFNLRRVVTSKIALRQLVTRAVA